MLAIGALAGGSVSCGEITAAHPSDAGPPDSSRDAASGTESGRVDGSSADAGVADSPPDAGSHDAAPSQVLVCGAQTCSGGAECCAIQSDAGFVLQCLEACPDGGAAVQCDSPQQCSADKNVCCGTLALTGAGTACTFGAASSACATSCTTAVSLGCPATEIVQFCAHSEDCTDPNNANCCTLTFNGQAETFCVSGTVAVEAAALLGATCLP